MDDIRRQMAQIRRELHEDMQGVVAGAEAASDWRYYVRRYPLPALAAAAVIGFLVVPRRRRTTSEIAGIAGEEAADRLEQVVRSVEARASRAVNQAAEVVDSSSPASKAEKEKRKSGVIGMLFGMATPILMRAAQNYAMNFIEGWIQQQQGMSMGMGPMAAQGGEPPSAGRAEPGSPGMPRSPGAGPNPGRPPGAGPRPI